MKTFYIVFTALLLATINLTAQIPQEINTIWTYSTSDQASGITNNNFILLPDSAVVFVTVAFEVSTSSYTFFLNKVSLDGASIIANKDLQIPVGLRVDRMFLNKTPGGGLIVVIQESTDITYVADYDNNLNLIWGKYINNIENTGFNLRTIYNVEVLSSGNIIIANNLTVPGPRPFAVGTAIVGLAANGDSLFDTSLGSRFINKITPGKNNTFGTTEYFIACCEQFIVLRSGSDGSVIEEIPVPSNIYISSDLAYQSLAGLYCLTTIERNHIVSYPGPNNFSLQLLDSNLNFKGTVPYNNVPNVNPNNIDLIEDPNKGLYFYQYVPSGSVNNEFIVLGRLDSTGKVLWTFTAEQPAAIIGNIKKVIPLPGNDFLVCVNTINGINIFRFRTNFQLPPSAINSTTSAQNPGLIKEQKGVFLH